MITIVYFYKRKLDHKWFKDEKYFYDVKKALRFMYKMDAKGRESFIDSYSCDDLEEQEYINQRFTLGRWFK